MEHPRTAHGGLEPTSLERTAMTDTSQLAVIYTRVSTVEQVSGFSLADQRRACSDYCARNGWKVARVFEERGESAKTADRTELQNLIGFVTNKKNRIAYVVVYDISRFSRDAGDFFVLTKTFERHGVTLRSATQDVDDSTMGTLMKTFLIGFAEFDNNLRRDKTVVGMKSKLESGEWPWKPPKGYRVVASPNGSVIEPEPEIAPLIRRAFEMFASDGYTAEQIRRHVGVLGLSSKRGTPIDRQSCNSLLQNPFYAGIVHSPRGRITVRGTHAPSC